VWVCVVVWGCGGGCGVYGGVLVVVDMVDAITCRVCVCVLTVYWWLVHSESVRCSA
jgi:hypothetical protein